MVPTFAISTVSSAVSLPVGGSAALAEFPLVQAVFFALLGGTVLNLMPCVFPVLSIKVLSFVQCGGKSAWEARKHGLVFALGVLTSFAVIAGLLIALRAGGAQIGWGFQLQSPLFVTLLAYLLFAMGLSLSGVFTIGCSLMGVGSSLAARHCYAGSFASGALTTVVATPCTAPFMGASVCFALTQPWYVALLVFQALGLGLALPYLLLSFSPALLRFLPRPGPWMERFKEFLAFPLYATAAWLIWVLSQQIGPTGVIVALAGMILIAFLAWLLRVVSTKHKTWRLAGVMAGMAAVGMTLGLIDLPGATAVSQDQGSRQGLAWEPFSRARLAELRANNQPVFINFTAAWCITCLANERLTLSSPEVAARLVEKGVIYLKGDWTNQDPEITAVLNEFGRSGVPLYVLYPPGQAEAKPIILPQILTESLLLERLERL